MTDDISNNSANDAGGGGSRSRRASFTANTLGSIFGRTSSVSNPNVGTPSLPTPITTAASGRRMSITTLGLSGTSPNQTSSFFPVGRRASISTNSDSIDESAIEEDEGPGRSVPTTPFARRLSFGAQALLNSRPGNGSPGAAGEGLNWSEQFRSRAESVVTRPALLNQMSPRSPATTTSHERAKSVSDMPAPPAATLPAPSIVPEHSALRRKPDAVGERMLRGEFHMD